jgi:hypothetical protein
MRTLIGLMLSVASYMLLVFELQALADPFTARLDGGMPGPLGTDPAWYQHALWIAALVLMGAAGAWLLSRGIVGRLVRGRGLVPGPVRP